MAHTSKTDRPYVLAAVLMSMFTAAVEGTIVATAMPSIVEKIGGFELYSWAFSAYLLMQAVTIPIYGKLADMYGRKPVMLFAIGLFLAGSIACGLATSMPMLIAFRIAQGIGAGGVLPVANILVGDLYTAEERGSIQGYLGSVWAISSVVGPLAGALIVRYTDWGWVFWVNTPFCLVAAFLVVRFLHEEVSHRRPAIDFAGAGLLLAGLLALMLALTHGGDWPAAVTAGLATGAAVLLRIFISVERRAKDPVVHLQLWSMPLIARANLTMLGAGIVMIGLISFLPPYLQKVLGASSLEAGVAICAMSLGWPIASFMVGRNLVRVGPRRIVRLGGAFLLVGSALVALLARNGPLAAGFGCFVAGAGLGLLNTASLISIQSSVSWQQRGAATASNILMRTLGNAVGAALFGGLLNVSLSGGGDAIGGMTSGFTTVFWAGAVAALVTFGFALRLPEVKIARGG